MNESAPFTIEGKRALSSELAGLGHDLLNDLTAVQLQGHLVALSLADANQRIPTDLGLASIERDLAELCATTDRATELLRQLLDRLKRLGDASTNGNDHGRAFESGATPAAPEVRHRGEGDHHDVSDEYCAHRAFSVIYIEDNVTNVRLMERVFEHRPTWELRVARTARDGLSLLEQCWPDLVLLDLNLPDVSGDDVLAEIREDADATRTPVIVLSADATPARIDRLRALGATDYCTKPLQIDAFLSLLDRYCAQSISSPQGKVPEDSVGSTRWDR